MSVQMIVLMLLFLIAFIMFYQNIPIGKKIGVVLIIISIFLIVDYTIFNVALSIENTRYISFDRHYNFVPFKTINSQIELIKNNSYKMYSLMNIIGNILMFAVLSFFICFTFDKMKTFKIVIICFVFSICIEIIQLFINRIVDIDDVILNTFGSIIGIVIALITKKTLYK